MKVYPDLYVKAIQERICSKGQLKTWVNGEGTKEKKPQLDKMWIRGESKH
jgi:hypothetical protein